MKNKIVVYTVVALVIILGVSVGVYFMRENKSPDNSAEKETMASSNGEQENVLATDDFSINLPQGWEARPAPMGASAMAVNVDENVTDPGAKKINFRSYFAVSYDTLQGRSQENYIQYIKDALKQSSPSASFFQEKQITVDGRDAYAMELEITQQGVNFKVLMIMVWAEGEDIWIISFNTTKDKWQEYANLFSQTVSTFSLKSK